MKIAIKGHKTRGQEVIEILESLGGKQGDYKLEGSDSNAYYWIKKELCNLITCHELPPENYIKYTLEEFKRSFPFKIGDCVQIKTGYQIRLATIVDIVYTDTYKVKYPNGGGIGFVNKEYISIYKEMNTRNITLTLEKAKEWYNNGGELKEVALQAFTEQELNPLPKSWEEYCKRYQVSSIMFGINVPNKYFALWKLEQLRDCYRQGWVPDWSSTDTKYCIVIESRTLNIRIHSFLNEFLSFQVPEVAKEFLKNFEPLIKEAGDLI